MLAPVARERMRQRAGAGPDFEEHITGLRIDRRNDLLRPGGREEMLPEPLAGLMERPVFRPAGRPAGTCAGCLAHGVLS